MLPSLFSTRYLMASRPSEYRVAMPSTPVSQHQKMAPGPPAAIATPTPMMFPAPMLAARATIRELNGEMSPLSVWSFTKYSLRAFSR